MSGVLGDVLDFLGLNGLTLEYFLFFGWMVLIFIFLAERYGFETNNRRKMLSAYPKFLFVACVAVFAWTTSLFFMAGTARGTGLSSSSEVLLYLIGGAWCISLLDNLIKKFDAWLGKFVSSEEE